MEPLENTVRDYAWGSPHGIPEIIGAVPDGRPAAELWVGAHPSAPSRVSEGSLGLDELIARAPLQALGRASVERFGERLPFLLKILSARTALSIQAHPDLDRARAGFAREEAAGIPVDAPHRIYRDRWHKPELIVALEDFRALSGFRPPSAIRATIDRLLVAAAPGDRVLLEEWRTVLERPDEAAALRAATGLVLRRAGEYGPLAARLARLPFGEADGHDASRVDSASDPLETLREVVADFGEDAGALVALMLCRIHLEPGRALALDAGVLHAYLGGLGVEVMASSDNVIRGGLTGKHIDVAELDAVVDFAGRRPDVLEPDADGLLRGAADDFVLQRIARADDRELARSGPLLLLCVRGGFTVRAGEEELVLPTGASVFVGAHEPAPRVTGDGLLFAATTGLGADTARHRA